MSASTWIIIENANLLTMPDEYVLTGASIYSPNSEYAII